MNCLVVIDYQVDKVAGSLADFNSELLDWQLVSKIRDYIENEDSVIYTCDEHPKEYNKCQESKIIGTPHCIKGTTGAKPYGEVGVYLSEFGVQCIKTSFGSTALARKLRGIENKLIEATKSGVELVEIAGCYLEYDVLSAAIVCRAALPESNIEVNVELTPYLNKDKAKIAISAMKQLGIIVK